MDDDGKLVKVRMVATILITKVDCSVPHHGDLFFDVAYTRDHPSSNPVQVSFWGITEREVPTLLTL